MYEDSIRLPERPLAVTKKKESEKKGCVLAVSSYYVPLPISLKADSKSKEEWKDNKSEANML